MLSYATENFFVALTINGKTMKMEKEKIFEHIEALKQRERIPNEYLQEKRKK